jgi:MFS transporter, SP family, galactose:H+ symporter
VTSSIPTVPIAIPPASGRTVAPWLMVVLTVVLFSGGLFGYDQGVISGALHGIRSTFSLSPLIVEVVTSWVTLGALFGALAGGELADRIGRGRTVLIAGAMFTLGSLVQALAPDTVILVGGRLIVGAGVGVAAVAAPLYAAELAPSTWRGRFVSAYQLAITVGIFLAYLIDGWLSASDAWRLMLGAAAIPGLLLFAVALVAPESPRWLMKMHRRADAATELRKIQPNVDSGPPRCHRSGSSSRFRPRIMARGLSPRMAPATVDRHWTRHFSTNHGYQRDHLLRRPNLFWRWLCHAILTDNGDNLGDRRRQRGVHPYRCRLH